jgi:hypothetical protein
MQNFYFYINKFILITYIRKWKIMIFITRINYLITCIHLYITLHLIYLLHWKINEISDPPNIHFSIKYFFFMQYNFVNRIVWYNLKLFLLFRKYLWKLEMKTFYFCASLIYQFLWFFLLYGKLFWNIIRKSNFSRVSCVRGLIKTRQCYLKILILFGS